MNDVLDHLEALIKDDREGLSEQLARGMAADFAEFKFIAGRVSALDTVLNAIIDIRKQLEKE